MEEVLLKRLSVFGTEIKGISERALNLCKNLKDEDVETSRIVSSKLQSILNRFNAELYNYFNISKEPNADEISELTAVQLNGEEILAELDTKIKIKTESTFTSQKGTDNTCASASKLPKLDLPEFEGDVLEWYQFWDQFSSNIDQRNLTDVAKLLYLKASLKGQAMKTIEGLETTNKNYQIAVLTLKERYGRQSQIIDAHYSALYKLKTAESITECRKTLSDIERHLRVLNSLGEDTSHNHLRFLIMEKFPEDIIYEMKMKLNTESIEDMRKQLEIIITAREDANRITKDRSTNDTEYTVETLSVNVKGEPMSRGTSVDVNRLEEVPKRKYEPHGKVNNTNFNNKRKRLSCIFCQEAHFNDMCDRVLTLEERKMKLGKRCYNCFREGHVSSKCKSKRLCVHCGKYGLHNRAMCLKRINPNTVPIKTLHIYEKGSTILQTAIVTVKGHNSVRFYYVIEKK